MGFPALLLMCNGTLLGGIWQDVAVEVASSRVCSTHPSWSVSTKECECVYFWLVDYIV